MRRLSLRALALCAALGLALSALTVASGASAHALVPAHARLAHADPGEDAVLTTAPTTVTLKFTEHMVPADSTITVYDVRGAVVSTGPATIPANDLKTMHVSMYGNGSEVYVVVWHNVSADDGHPDAGAYTFTVSKGARPSPGHQPT
jgi:methionine-rich copper-binding protein CopC